jgi:hypothetical protein
MLAVTLYGVGQVFRAKIDRAVNRLILWWMACPKLQKDAQYTSKIIQNFLQTTFLHTPFKFYPLLLRFINIGHN